MTDIQANLLAFFVLLALLFCGIASFISVIQSTPVDAKKGWHSSWLLLFAILGFPGLYNLLQTNGITLGLALWVLLVLLVTIGVSLQSLFGGSPIRIALERHPWLLPALVTGGLVVAGYLTYVDLTDTPSVCGVGTHGCVTVQSSSYAHLFGFLPVGLLGLVGFLAILGVWLAGRSRVAIIKKTTPLALWGLCFFGVAFSAYLTYLEVFVIQATCIWCVTSAVLMMLLLWVATPGAQRIFLNNQEEDPEGVPNE